MSGNNSSWLEQLNLKLAVSARRTLTLGVTKTKVATKWDRYELVWRPTQKLLNNLSRKKKPLEKFICFVGRIYIFPGETEAEGVAADIFFIGKNRVAYLGTLLNKAADKLYLEKTGVAEPEKADPSTIWHDELLFRLAAKTEDLYNRTAEKAVKRYLAEKAPALIGCRIKWLPRKIGIALEQKIHAEAKATAYDATDEERVRIRIEEKLRLW